MDQAWLEIIDRLTIEDAIRLRRTSSKVDNLVSKSLKSMRHLDVQMHCPSVIRDSVAMASVIAQCSYNLQTLDLKIRSDNAKYAGIPSDVKIRRNVMTSINENATKLRKLHIDRCRISPGAIGSFGDLPDSIEEISITNSMIECSEWDVATIIRKSFGTLLKKCRKLRYFEISGQCLMNSHFHVDPKILQFISNTVEHLAIAVGHSLTINSLAFLKDKRLKTLNLQRSFISPCDLEHIVAMADTITHLDLSRSVNLLDCRQIAELVNLRHLSLKNNKEGVRDDSLQLIIKNCSKLEELSLDCCEYLTVNSLITLGNLNNLKQLSLPGIVNVDDSVCLQISRCSKLTYLNINFCRRVQKRGLLCLLSCLTSLDHLEVLGIRAYSHHLLALHINFPKTIVSDYVESISIIIPPIPPPIPPSAIVKA
ncbi:F-box domain-containing protein [Caenorhabditis elegans]|uniref:F-box domain-containing protein n=1 Tax=Caenorhabditis elegans TaxID=6239 RepID=Q17531_CAEEL|nr:F-box domain-containing protein [Caenorhabditis elegans]NP_502528.2 F-box domain-containing protein [Caenorhabditis elegans]CAA97768.1 F-box domain-containing protein [Caenorhabditis elegans]CAJ76980.2 F-box domain-containing protein [Caenorhabditis elegans]|eukprot:NP_502527.1 Uncharacterized protein CELE_B0564.6 [Caenorhabditis elegans]